MPLPCPCSLCAAGLPREGYGGSGVVSGAEVVTRVVNSQKLQDRDRFRDWIMDSSFDLRHSSTGTRPRRAHNLLLISYKDVRFSVRGNGCIKYL